MAYGKSRSLRLVAIDMRQPVFSCDQNGSTQQKTSRIYTTASRECDQTAAIPHDPLEFRLGDIGPVTSTERVLFRLGITFSMVWNDKGCTTRFVVTMRRSRSFPDEGEVLRGDVSAAAGERQDICLESYYGPIPPPTSDDQIQFHARWAVLTNSTSYIECGSLPVNEIRATAYVVDGFTPLLVKEFTRDPTQPMLNAIPFITAVGRSRIARLVDDENAGLVRVWYSEE